jgi:tetratricopeptide (TPR) repeat protein
MRTLSRPAVWTHFRRYGWLFAVTFSVAFGASSAVPVAEDPGLAPFNRVIAEHPADVTALIARTRYRFAKLNQGRKDIGDYPLGANYAYEDVAFTDALKPILNEIDDVIARQPESAALLIERSRIRLVYQACSSGHRGYIFGFADPVKDLVRATEMEPANAAAWYELGLAHLSLWLLHDHTMTRPQLVGKEDARMAKKRVGLTAALHAFSRAILASPESSGFAHLMRLKTQRALARGVDLNQTLVDTDAIIRQDLAPTDPAWDSVLHSARPAAKRASYLAEAHFLRGQVRVARGEFTAGLADFDHVLVLEPADSSVPFDRGRLFVQRGDYARAIADLDALVKARPYFAEGWFWRGVAHDGAGEIELARADFDQAIKYDKTIGQKLTHSRYDLMAPDPARGLAPQPITVDARIVPSGTALEHKNAGNALRGKGDEFGALGEYSAAVLIDPTFADGYNNRGSSYRTLQEIDLALADLNHAIELDPKHRVAYLNRAIVWGDLGDNSRARADYDHAVDYADSDFLRGQAHVARGHMKETDRDNKAAEADYRRASELNPVDGAAWRSLGLLELKQSRFPSAIESFRQALKRDPKNVINRVYLAVILAVQRNESAGAELETAIRDHTTSDQLEEAEQILDRAIKSYPNSEGLKALKESLRKSQGKGANFV